jgi:hypothetical protein
VILVGIIEFTRVKGHTVAHCVANPINSAPIRISIQKFTQVNSHSFAHCVANHLRGGTVWQSTIEKFILKKLIAVEVLPQQEFPVDPEKAYGNVF